MVDAPSDDLIGHRSSGRSEPLRRQPATPPDEGSPSGFDSALDELVTELVREEHLRSVRRARLRQRH